MMNKLPNCLAPHQEIFEKAGISLDHLFDFKPAPLKERLIRSYLAPFSYYLPTRLRYKVTNIFKKLRNPQRLLKINYAEDFPEIHRVKDQIIKLNLNPWWDRKGVVCISHDVDNDEGYRFVPKLAKINEEYGFKSTFNFLTHDQYTTDKNLLDSLKSRGFEVGLHGYTHDQGFAYRNKKIIRKKLLKSKEKIDLNASGYRSPALSISSNLFHSLSEENFTYDSSLQIGSPFYWSVKAPYPIYLDKYNLWELPLMIQDDNYFRDSNTSYPDALKSIERLIDETAQINGVFVINMHPHIIQHHVSFYHDFLKMLSNNSNITIRTSGEVINYAKSSSDHC